MKKLLQTWIREKGEDLPAFAAKMEIPYGTFYGYARADRQIPQDVLHSVAKELGIPPDSILQKCDTIEEPSSPYRASSGFDDLTDIELQTIICSRITELKKDASPDRHVAIRAVAGAASVLERRWSIATPKGAD